MKRVIAYVFRMFDYSHPLILRRIAGTMAGVMAIASMQFLLAGCGGGASGGTTNQSDSRGIKTAMALNPDGSGVGVISSSGGSAAQKTIDVQIPEGARSLVVTNIDGAGNAAMANSTVTFVAPTTKSVGTDTQLTMGNAGPIIKGGVPLPAPQSQDPTQYKLQIQGLHNLTSTMPTDISRASGVSDCQECTASQNTAVLINPTPGTWHVNIQSNVNAKSYNIAFAIIGNNAAVSSLDSLTEQAFRQVGVLRQ